MTPMQRSLKLLRDRGFLCGITEHWNPFAKIRKDLFGFADLIAIRTAPQQTIFVQTTSMANLAARVAKIKSLPGPLACLQAGHSVQAHGWRKLKRSWKWEVAVVELAREDWG